MMKLVSVLPCVAQELKLVKLVQSYARIDIHSLRTELISLGMPRDYS